ncbi:hypothetical protein ACJX0J_042145, partial [Zea mays]
PYNGLSEGFTGCWLTMLCTCCWLRPSRPESGCRVLVHVRLDCGASLGFRCDSTLRWPRRGRTSPQAFVKVPSPAKGVPARFVSVGSAAAAKASSEGWRLCLRPNTVCYCSAARFVTAPQQDLLVSSKHGAGNKSEKDNSTLLDKAGNAPVVKEQSIDAHASKSRAQNGKTMPNNGGSLANMWGRASAKPKPPSTTNSTVVESVAATLDAQICAKEEADGDSSNDEQRIKYKRESTNANNRKRRAVFDFLDDDEVDNIISIASLEVPKQRIPDPVIETAEGAEVNQKNLENKDDVPNTEKGSSMGVDSDFTSECKTKTVNTMNHSGITLKENSSDPPVSNKKQDSAVEPASTTPKRRKVLKTRIDEREGKVYKSSMKKEEKYLQGDRRGGDGRGDAEAELGLWYGGAA